MQDIRSETPKGVMTHGLRTTSPRTVSELSEEFGAMAWFLSCMEDSYANVTKTCFHCYIIYYSLKTKSNCLQAEWLSSDEVFLSAVAFLSFENLNYVNGAFSGRVRNTGNPTSSLRTTTRWHMQYILKIHHLVEEADFSTDLLTTELGWVEKAHTQRRVIGTWGRHYTSFQSQNSCHSKLFVKNISRFKGNDTDITIKIVLF